MQPPVFITNSLGWVAFEFARLQPFIPTYLHLLVSAVLPIYAGSHASLSRPSSAAKRPKKSLDEKSRDEDEDNGEEVEQQMEGLSPQDALLFPILAGLMLTGLYFLITWLQDPALLNKILNWYFATFSVFSVSRLVSDGMDVFHSLMFPHDYVDGGVLFHVDAKSRIAIPAVAGASARSSPLPGIFSRLPLPQPLVQFLWTLHAAPNRKIQFKIFIRRVLHAKFRLGTHGIEGLLVGLSTVFWYNFVSKPWWLTNLMGFGFAYGTLQLMSPTTFWTGTMILSGLFCYDIYFVFFTPMMVTVAKSLDIPIKLLFPRPSEADADPTIIPMSMLGLGDIVLPGIIIGLALRFDLYMFYLRKQTSVDSDTLGQAEGDRQVHEDENKRSSATSSSPIKRDVLKATYRSVAQGWGDRLWTTAFLTGRYPQHGYSARNLFPKPYFHASLYGYIAGMLVTLGVMQASNHAQPALLYLVPGVLASLWGTAYVRGEIKTMWNFSDAAEDTQPKDVGLEEGKKTEGSGSIDRTSPKAEQTSFFSFGRSEARLRKLEKATNERSSDGRENDKVAESAENDQKPREDEFRGRWFSFSVDLPRLKDARQTDHPSHQTLVEDASSRYSLRSRESGAKEPAEKRQRLS